MCSETRSWGLPRSSGAQASTAGTAGTAGEMDRGEGAGGGGAGGGGGASGAGGAGGSGGHRPWTQTSDLAGIFETAFAATSLERPLRSGQYTYRISYAHNCIRDNTCACVHRANDTSCIFYCRNVPTAIDYDFFFIVKSGRNQVFFLGRSLNVTFRMCEIKIFCYFSFQAEPFFHLTRWNSVLLPFFAIFSYALWGI